MKHIQFYIILVLGALLTGAIIFWHHSHNTTSIVPTNVVTNIAPSPIATNLGEFPASNQVATTTYTAADLARMVAAQNEKYYKMFGITPDMSPEQIRQKVKEWYVAESAKMAAQNQHPIFFYGQTLDESNDPVAGVNIQFSLSEPPNPGPHGVLEKDTQSDDQGYFHFEDAIGKTLIVGFYKNGYYSSKSNRTVFDYTSYQPNPLQPEILHLRKKGVGADLITSKYGVIPDFTISVPKDGTPIWVDLLQRKAGGSGQMQIQLWNEIDQAARKITVWRLHLEIPDGGFVAENDEFPFEAPESGYQPELDFPVPDASGNIRFGISHKTYYVYFGQPRKYGRIDISASDHTGDVWFQYAINPDGIRYLEPKP